MPLQQILVWAALVAFALGMLALQVGCAGIAYRDTVTPDGLLNLHRLAPGTLRVGRPDTLAKWVALDERIRAEPGDDTRAPLFVQLHFDAEADDAPFTRAIGWDLLKVPLEPEDGKPWTVVESSPPSEVLVAVRAIVAAHQRGQRVAFGCMADRDRGSLVAALVGMVIYGWPEETAWQYMQKTGSRIGVLPGLLDSFLRTAPDLRREAMKP